MTCIRIQQGWVLIRHSCLVKQSHPWVPISIRRNRLILFLLSVLIPPRDSGPVRHFCIQWRIVWLFLSCVLPCLRICICIFSLQIKVCHVLGKLVLLLVGVGLFGGYAWKLLGVGLFRVGLKGWGACSLWSIYKCYYLCSLLYLLRGLSCYFPQKLLPHGQGTFS